MRIYLSILLVAGVAQANVDDPVKPSLEVRSPAFNPGGTIPVAYTCDGDAKAPPPLAWSKPPAGTRSLAILVADPDAPNATFTHWLVTGVPVTATKLRARLPRGAVAGRNDSGRAGWTPPCPPHGRHRYLFEVFALDTRLASTPQSRAELLHAIDGHVLAQGTLVGTYER